MKTRSFLPLLLAAAAFFGGVAGAAALAPRRLDWRTATVSRMAMYPANNPRGYWIADLGIVLAGIALYPCGGRLARKLGGRAAWAGAMAFRAGSLGAVLTGLVAYRADVRLPALHTALARGTALLLCAAMLLFWLAAVAARRTALAVAWGLLVFAAPAAVALGIRAVGPGGGPAGLYEWAAVVVLFLFLLAGLGID